jgi:hypothetical protein
VLHTQNCSSDPALGSAARLSHTGSIIIEHAGANPLQVEFTMVQRGIPWCGRAGGRRARDRRARDRRAGRRGARNHHAAPAARSLSTQHSFTRLFPQSISNHGVTHRTSRWSRDMTYDIPWCGRAGGRRARDNRAATATEIALNNSLGRAPLPTKHLKPWSRIDYCDC